MNTLKPWQVQPLSNIGIRFPSQRLTNDAISTKICRSATDQSADLSGKIEQGFGSNGLGIPSISEVPGYTSLRRNLLRLAPRYNIGWSHGKEQLESGKPDMMKGSYYANPILDVPTTVLSHVERYPSYCGPNIWPRDSVPELELHHQMVSNCTRMKVYYKYFFDLDVIKVVSFIIFILFRGTLDSLKLLSAPFREFMVPDESISFGDYTEKLLDKCYDLK